jgi:hypothetical protein
MYGGPRHLCERCHVCGATSTASFGAAVKGHTARLRPALRSGPGMTCCGLLRAVIYARDVIYASAVIYAAMPRCHVCVATSKAECGVRL